MTSSNWRTYFALIFATIGWALSFVWFKVANVVYDPLTIILARLVISTIVLFLFLKLSGRLIVPNKKEWRLLFLMALFQPFLYFLGESYGLLYVSSTLGAVIIATIPLFAVIPARLIYKEQPGGNFFTGAVLSLVGVLFVVFESGSFVMSSGIGLGVALEFGAVFCSVAYSTVLRKIPVRLSPFAIILYQNLIGAFYFLPFWLYFEAHEVLATPFNIPAFMAIVKLAIVASIFGFAFYTYGIRHLGVSRASIFINAIPGFTAVFAWSILGESLTFGKIIGFILLIFGLWLAQREKFTFRNVIAQILKVRF